PRDRRASLRGLEGILRRPDCPARAGQERAGQERPGRPPGRARSTATRGRRKTSVATPLAGSTVSRLTTDNRQPTTDRMNYVLGTAGHIDHGKTALVRALTGVDTDRLPAEKQRGITIDLGFASLELGECQMALIDVPGHERFIRNMLAGASGLD